jgi:hypothetical protein
MDRPVIRWLFALAALISLSVPPVTVAAEVRAGAAVPYRAVYTMTLLSARSGSGIAAVRGEMAVQWLQDCQGWTAEHLSELEIAFVESEPVRLSTRATSWESADSTQYIFAVRHVADGEETERVEGHARVTTAEEGLAAFTAPEPRNVVLPRGTLFPLAHAEAVLAAAERARAPVTLSRHVFDGMGADGPFEVNAIISPARSASPSTPATAVLAGLAAWRLNLAYFPVSAPEAEPKHEMAMRIYANGVVDELTIDFGDFSVRAVLEQLEILDAAACTGTER